MWGWEPGDYCFRDETVALEAHRFKSWSQTGDPKAFDRKLLRNASFTLPDVQLSEHKGAPACFHTDSNIQIDWHDTIAEKCFSIHVRFELLNKFEHSLSKV